MSTIITRNSANSGSVPSSLVQGELAINVTDGKLFYGSGSGNVVKEFTGSGGGGGTIDTSSFATTGSNIFIGNQIISGSLHQSGTFYPDQIDWFSSSIGYNTGSYILTTTANGLTTYAGYGDVANTLAPYIPTVSASVSASYATTASYIQNAQTASYALQSVSSSFATTASYVSSNFQYEIHVSQIDGNDTTGDGSLLKPVATVTKALTLLGASRKTIIIHPGTYSENVTVADTNTTISTSELTGANTLLSGTLTIGTLGSGTRISGLKMSSLVISGTAQAYISNCTVDNQVTKSSSGYVEIINSELQCISGIQISGAGITIINGNKNVAVSVSNASAQVIIKGCNSVVTPSASAGNLAIVDCIVTALGGNGITITGSSTTLTLLNSQVLVTAGNNVAPISVAGIYSIINTIYDKPGSSLTGISTNSIDYFQYIDADNVNTKGLSVTGSITVSGSVINNLTASYAISAFQALSSSFAATASYVQNAQTASYALNGGVTQLLAGPNVTLSPTNGLGQVTVSAILSGSTSFNTATGSYGSFYDTTTQTNPVANIARSMSFNSTDITNGVSISGSTNPFNTYIKTENAGIYNIQFSAQVDKTDSGADEIVIWLRKNGIDLTDTATTLTLSGNNDKQVAAWNWFVTSATGDYYQIIWRSADTDLRLLAEPISIDHPGIPSVILTVNRVDQFLSNTGSFSGSFTGLLLGTASYATQALSASYATTASYVLQAVSASYATNSLSASFASTASYIQNAQTASYVLQAVSASYATTASYSNTSTSASYALSASYAPSTPAFPYNGDARISGSLGVTGSFAVQTYDGIFANAYVDAIRISDGGRAIYDIFGTGSIDAGGRVLIDNMFLPSLGWLTRTMFDGTANPSIDWKNRIAYDGTGTTYALDWNNRFAFDGTGTTYALDWNNRFAFDGVGIPSISWGSRLLNDSAGFPALSWDVNSNNYKIETSTYLKKSIPPSTQESFSDVPTVAFNYEGEVIGGQLDGTVAQFDLVYLETDGKWYPVTQATTDCSKLLGICAKTGVKSEIILEGSITVNDGTYATTPRVQFPDHGLPIYIRESGGNTMSTNVPTTAGQYVRILGHAYYQNTGTPEYWVMKFRPSNDWYVI